MRLLALKLANFRNFERVEFRFEKEKTILSGENGLGKSNLLEATYFLAIGKSGRGARDRDVLRWGAGYFSIEGIVEEERGTFPIRLGYDPAVGKKAHLRERAVPHLSGLIGAFNAVLFSPEDVDLVLRNRAQRRRILDILVSQSSVSYLSDLERYRRVLSQRNRLLKASGAQLLADPARMSPWNHQLAEVGARIVGGRLDALHEMGPWISRYYSEISAASEALKAEYQSLVDSDRKESAQEVLEAALMERLRDEVEQGFTLSGPHRDNLVFRLGGRTAQRFASMGQLKSVLLAWKLAEARFLESKTGTSPVLLMDDIFSELDRRRACSLMALLSSFGQVLLTTARDSDLDFEAQGYQIVAL